MTPLQPIAYLSESPAPWKNRHKKAKSAMKIPTKETTTTDVDANANVNMCNCKCIYVVEVILGDKALFQEIRMKGIK
jgi:hypothetical protein